MFASPYEMYIDETRNYRMEYQKRELIEDALDEYKKDALEKIGKVTDVFYTDAIALTIASGYENELETAIDIVNRLNLNDKHIAALLNDYAMMEQILSDEAAEDEHYENQGE